MLVVLEVISGWALPEPTQYKFKEFSYYETRKNEALFREYVKACEQSPECWAPPYTDSALERTACIRLCVSQTCYSEVRLGSTITDHRCMDKIHWRKER